MLAQRVASAAVGVPIILLLIWFGGPWYLAAVCAALAVASLEYQHAQGREWADPVAVLFAAVNAGIAVGAYIGHIEWGIWIGAATAVAAIAVVLNPVDDHSRERSPGRSAACSTSACSAARWSSSARSTFDGKSWVYVTVLGTFATDTAAFFTGRAVGRTPLAPDISPNKTVEGFIGGWMGGFAAVLVAAYALREFEDLYFEPWHVMVIGLSLPLAATVGDLVESAMKRARHIKDASELIPGHGGVLDRLDSILFTFPTVYLFVEFVVTR